MTRQQDSGFRIQDSGAEARRTASFRPSSLDPHPSALRRPSTLVPRPSSLQSGFTLIELLVAISILLILATITFTMVGAAMKGDNIRSAARQIQSYVEGARDRAIHAKADRGVRFLRDPNNPARISSMIFVQAQDPETEGQIHINVNTTPPTSPGPRFFSRKLQAPAIWTELQEKGLLDGNTARIEIYSSSSSKAPYTMIYQDDYLVDGPPATLAGTKSWYLTKDYNNGVVPDTMTGDDWGDGLNYILYLGPAVLPNQEPRLLPAGIHVDLANSRVPWTTTENFDLMFSPRGTITGARSASGNIHLLLADIRDIERGLGPLDVDGSDANSTIDPHERHQGETLIVSITTQTGKVTSHPVSHTPGDLFEYAETGAEAK